MRFCDKKILSLEEHCGKGLSQWKNETRGHRQSLFIRYVVLTLCGRLTGNMHCIWIIIAVLSTGVTE